MTHKLELCKESRFKHSGIDIRLVSTVYNICYWTNRDHAFIFIPGERLSIAMVRFDGSFELYSEECGNSNKIVEGLEFVMGFKDNVNEFYELAIKDPLLSDFAETYHAWRLRSTDLWWALVTGICQQNASFKQGWRILHNIVRSFNKRVLLGKYEIYRPPSPREVIEDPGKLIETGAGFRAKALLNTAKTIASGVIETKSFLEKEPQEMERVLREISGIGPYTARFAIALFARKYDLPPVDRWLKKIIRTMYGVDEKYAEEFWINKWGKWSALATIATTITLDAEPLTKALQRLRRRELLPKLNTSPSPINMNAFCT